VSRAANGLAVFRQKFGTFWHLPGQEKVWLLCLFLYSGVVRLALLILPFRWLAPLLGVHHKNHQLSPLVAQPMLHAASRIGRIVEIATRYTPWESKCLVQAILVRTMFACYKIPYVLHLGTVLTRGEKRSMKGHAWVKVGPRIVIGRKGHFQYAVVSSFVSPLVVSAENSPHQAMIEGR